MLRLFGQPNAGHHNRRTKTRPVATSGSFAEMTHQIDHPAGIGARNAASGNGDCNLVSRSKSIDADGDQTIHQSILALVNAALFFGFR